YAAVATGDAATVLDSYDPEVEWDFSHSPFATVFRRTVYRGHEGIRELARERHEEAWESIVDELDVLIDADQHVICVVTSGGRGRASGAQVSRVHAAVWTFKAGRVARVVWFATREEAEIAAGRKG
ncbi:MAG: nuclear transport factor 2 family protein, partial [Solirubrobacterales bacterium]|nr:nuclear transport factor 2 family protein [Solirubrobacterales bacterium]